MSNSYATSWTVALQFPLSMGFPRQEYESGLPFSYPGTFPTPAGNPCLLHWQTDSLPLSRQGSPNFPCRKVLNHNSNSFDIGLFRFSISVLLICSFQGFYPDYLRFLFVWWVWKYLSSTQQISITWYSVIDYSHHVFH